MTTATKPRPKNHPFDLLQTISKIQKAIRRLQISTNNSVPIYYRIATFSVSAIGGAGTLVGSVVSVQELPDLSANVYGTTAWASAQFTAPTPGLYNLFMNIDGGRAATRCDAGIEVNGTRVAQGSAPNGQAISGSVPDYFLNAGDVVAFIAFNGGTTATWTGTVIVSHRSNMQ